MKYIYNICSDTIGHGKTIIIMLPVMVFSIFQFQNFGRGNLVAAMEDQQFDVLYCVMSLCYFS